MARPESQATAGYFPTPDHLLSSIASLVALERQRFDQPLFFDPCAGTGQAIVTLAAEILDLDPWDAGRYCKAIELEATRAEALARRLPHGWAHHGDAVTFGLDPRPGASLLFLNPPYDTDRELRRLEQRFLARFTEALAPGGALVFVVPHYALAASADFLASRYTEIGVWRFPDPDFSAFRQVVLLGRRRTDPTPPDRSTADRLRAAAESAADLPVLPTRGGEPHLLLEPSHASLTLTPHAIDVRALLERSQVFAPTAAVMGYDREARALLGSPLPVVLPARPAHIALALAAGLLNGRLLLPNDPSRLPPLLAKGTLTRILQTVDHRRNRDGVVTGEVFIQQPRLDLQVLCLDRLTFHRLALGSEPSGATAIGDFNTADLLEHYSASLAELVREQLPALHDPDDPNHQIALPELARRPFRAQAELIQAGLKLLALGENPQVLAEVGTGKSTIAFSIAGALLPAHFQATTAALGRAGFDPRRLRPIERVLVLCPPHLLKSWTDQARAVLPEARVQIVRVPSDLDRPAAIYVLSREVAKFGSTIEGVRSRRCPDCGHPLPPGDPESFATQRRTCEEEIVLPVNLQARLARDLGLALYRSLDPDTLDQLLPYLGPHPAAYRRAQVFQRRAEPVPLTGASLPALRAAYERLLPELERHLLHDSPHESRLWKTFSLASDLALLLDDFEGFETTCEAFAGRRAQVATEACGYLAPIESHLEDQLDACAPTRERLRSADRDAVRRDLLGGLVEDLLREATWISRGGCGAPLYTATPEPRRYPLARYIRAKKRRHFDLVIADEVHEAAGTGSAQQRATHRLVQLPGVPTIALTGSLMGGYASSLFQNAWALSRRFREEFEIDERAAFVARYGYRKFLVETGAGDRSPALRSYGRQTDRTEGDAPLIRQLGEAPGVLPLYILRYILPTGLVMHKGDLDDELPPCQELPVAIRPAADDLLDAKLLAEFARLRRALVAALKDDRGTERAGLLLGAMAELPSYLDLASEECGEYVLAYPEEVGGEVVATGASFPASWRSPKERWLLDEIRQELDAGRRVLVFLRHTGNPGFLRRLHRLILVDLQEPATFLDPARVSTGVREAWLDRVIASCCRLRKPAAIW
jgi:hypothetical protein